MSYDSHEPIAESEQPVIVRPKSPFMSKTNWVAAIAMVIAVIQVVMDSELTTDDIDKALLAAMGFITIILRTWFTVAPTTMIAASLPKARSTIVLLLLAINLFASEAFAQKVYVEIDGGTVGKFLVESDGKGNVTANPIRVVKPGQTPLPPPVIDPIDPVVLTERAKLIKTAAEKVTADPDRDGTAKGLAELCRQLSKLIRTGQIADINQAALVVKMGSDTFLAQRKVATQWQATRDVLNREWVAVAAKGGGLEDYAKLLDETANGLDASAPLKNFDPALLALIMKIIDFIMSILNR